MIVVFTRYREYRDVVCGEACWGDETFGAVSTVWLLVLDSDCLCETNWRAIPNVSWLIALGSDVVCWFIEWVDSVGIFCDANQIVSAIELVKEM